jgi:adenosine kinase
MFDGEELLRFIDQADWLAVNDYEWQMVRERTGLTAEELTRRLQALIITRGGKGSVIHTADGEIRIPAARPAAVKDPTGCGDAYRAGLIYGLNHGLDWETTGRIASLMGAIKIEHFGTQKHRFTMDEFRARFREEFGRDF